MRTMMMTYVGVGTSGAPGLWHRDRLAVEPVATDDYRCGDLAVYLGNRIQICHRILYRRQEAEMTWFFMKGDGNLEPDGWIPEYRMLGRVAGVNGRAPAPARAERQRLIHLALHRAQWWLYERLFLSRFGAAMRGLRELMFPEPIFQRAFRGLSEVTFLCFSRKQMGNA